MKFSYTKNPESELFYKESKSNKRAKMALNRSPEVKAVIVQMALLAILFYF